MQTKLVDVGSVKLVEIPENALKNANISVGDTLNVSAVDGVLVLSPLNSEMPPLATNNAPSNLSMTAFIKYSELKKELQFNDNIASIVLHLSAVKIDTFSEMKALGVIQEGYRCFSDLGVNIKRFITSKKEGGKVSIKSTAHLTKKGYELAERLNSLNISA